MVRWLPTDVALNAQERCIHVKKRLDCKGELICSKTDVGRRGERGRTGILPIREATLRLKIKFVMTGEFQDF